MAEDDPFADLGETLENEPDEEPQGSDEASESEAAEQTSPQEPVQQRDRKSVV